jgi:hypothetical protein
MRRTMISYKVRPEAAEDNERLIRGVFDELSEAAPENVRYVALVLEDGVSFVHLVEVEDGDNPIPELSSFKRYSESVVERSEAAPVVNQARAVGSYRFGRA